MSDLIAIAYPDLATAQDVAANACACRRATSWSSRTSWWSSARTTAR